MASAPAEVEAQKQAAAQRALELVKPGTIVGLGTGSTVAHFLPALARRNLDVMCVATSVATEDMAHNLGLATQPFDLLERLDLAVDGADQVAPDLWLVKGGGGAHTREKIVAHASRRFVLIADESKLVGRLGRGPVPIEVLPFLWEATSRSIESLGGRPELRMAPGGPFTTDNGNLVLDASFGTVDAALGVALHAIPGVIEHGLFFGMARAAIVGSATGVRVLGELP